MNYLVGGHVHFERWIRICSTGTGFASMDPNSQYWLRIRSTRSGFAVLDPDSQYWIRIRSTGSGFTVQDQQNFLDSSDKEYMKKAHKILGEKKYDSDPVLRIRVQY